MDVNAKNYKPNYKPELLANNLLANEN